MAGVWEGKLLVKIIKEVRLRKLVGHEAIVRILEGLGHPGGLVIQGAQCGWLGRASELLVSMVAIQAMRSGP